MKRLLVGFQAALLLACGGGGDAGDEAVGKALLQPLEVGTTWVYYTTRADGSGPERKTTTVVRKEELNGSEASVFESVRGNLRTLVWLARDGDRIVRLREESWEGNTLIDRRGFRPGSLRAPATLADVRVGDVIDGGYEEQALAEDGTVLGARQRSPAYQVEAIDAEVRTPAGTFRAVQLLKLGDDGEEGKRVWYVPGVGKVREEGGRIEVLQRFQPAPRE